MQIVIIYTQNRRNITKRKYLNSKIFISLNKIISGQIPLTTNCKLFMKSNVVTILLFAKDNALIDDRCSFLIKTFIKEIVCYSKSKFSVFLTTIKISIEKCKY